jgi:hypothetical protein
MAPHFSCHVFNITPTALQQKTWSIAGLYSPGHSCYCLHFHGFNQQILCLLELKPHYPCHSCFTLEFTPAQHNAADEAYAIHNIKKSSNNKNLG